MNNFVCCHTYFWSNSLLAQMKYFLNYTFCASIIIMQEIFKLQAFGVEATGNISSSTSESSFNPTPVSETFKTNVETETITKTNNEAKEIHADVPSTRTKIFNTRLNPFSDDDLEAARQRAKVGATPRVGFLPQPDQIKNVSSTLISYDRNRGDTWKLYTNQLDSVFYNIPALAGRDVTLCRFGNGGTDTYKNKNKMKEQIYSCFVNNNQLGECNPGNFFGYRLGEPCILLGLNAVNGWEPQGFGLNGKLYNPAKFNEIFANDMRELAEKRENRTEQGLKVMPKFLQEYIKTVAAHPTHSIQWKTDVLNSVFYSCEGSHSHESGFIGPLTYYPQPYVPSYYFPFSDQFGYQTPFIMVQMKLPVIGVPIDVECRAWA